MSKLRLTSQREVMDALDATIFTSDDFYVSFGDSANEEPLVSIQFKFNEKYDYVISKYRESFEVVRRPGKLEDVEETYCNEFDQALNNLKFWCREIRNELKSSQPLYSEVDALKETIEKLINGDEKAIDFSVEEIFELNKKFEDLLARVEVLEADKIITETQLREFNDGVNQIKEDLEFYPKQTWVQTATNKLVKIVMSIGKSKEGRALLADGAKKLLGI